MDLLTILASSVAYIIIGWLMLLASMLVFSKCVGWSLRIVKAKRFSRGE